MTGSTPFKAGSRVRVSGRLDMLWAWSTPYIDDYSSQFTLTEPEMGVLLGCVGPCPGPPRIWASMCDVLFDRGVRAFIEAEYVEVMR